MKNIPQLEKILSETKQRIHDKLQQYVHLIFSPKARDGLRGDFIKHFENEFRKLLNKNCGAIEGKIREIEYFFQLSLQNTVKKFNTKLERMSFQINGISSEGKNKKN